MPADQPRFLHRRSEQGYTQTVLLAADKLECVSADEQRRQTEQAHRRWRLERQRAWGATASAINGALDAFVKSEAAHNDDRLRSGVRAVRRSVDALGRCVEHQ